MRPHPTGNSGESRGRRSIRHQRVVASVGSSSSVPRNGGVGSDCHQYLDVIAASQTNFFPRPTKNIHQLKVFPCLSSTHSAKINVISRRRNKQRLYPAAGLRRPIRKTPPLSRTVEAIEDGRRRGRGRGRQLHRRHSDRPTDLSPLSMYRILHFLSFLPAAMPTGSNSTAGCYLNGNCGPSEFVTPFVRISPWRRDVRGRAAAARPSRTTRQVVGTDASRQVQAVTSQPAGAAGSGAAATAWPARPTVSLARARSGIGLPALNDLRAASDANSDRCSRPLQYLEILLAVG